ncbi:MAG: DUF4867 family protein [Lachnospiraceae bacterium]|nr:DUF4867 family protein [Lachnospiraceae bacterium]
MSRLEELQAKNPQIKIYSVLDDEFLPYGAVIDADVAAMSEMVKKAAPIPEQGSRYVTALKEIDEMPEAKKYNELYCGQLDEQWGLCWGHNSLLNALEWHTCNEFNIGVSDLVLLLAKRGEIDKEGRLDSAKVKAFYLPEGVMIEVFSDTMHFAPCEVSKDGFWCVVGLQRGTNERLDPDMEKTPLLLSKNKWLIAHESSKMAEFGCFAGIYGENWEIRTID